MACERFAVAAAPFGTPMRQLFASVQLPPSVDFHVGTPPCSYVRNQFVGATVPSLSVMAPLLVRTSMPVDGLPGLNGMKPKENAVSAKVGVSACAFAPGGTKLPVSFICTALIVYVSPPVMTSSYTPGRT